MKQCPECKHVYYDETLNFCLDDGASLVYGPATDEAATAIIPSSEITSDEPSSQRNGMKYFK